MIVIIIITVYDYIYWYVIDILGVLPGSSIFSENELNLNDLLRESPFKGTNISHLGKRNVRQSATKKWWWLQLQGPILFRNKSIRRNFGI